MCIRDRSTFEATVKVYELLGAEVYLYFDLDEFQMTARVDPRTTARPGDVVKFAIDVEKIHIFDKETELVKMCIRDSHKAASGSSVPRYWHCLKDPTSRSYVL